MIKRSICEVVLATILAVSSGCVSPKPIIIPLFERESYKVRTMSYTHRDGYGWQTDHPEIIFADRNNTCYTVFFNGRRHLVEVGDKIKENGFEFYVLKESKGILSFKIEKK